MAELLSKGVLWGESHLQENVLEFPSVIPAWDPIELPFRLRPGRVALRLLPPREVTAGGLLLPSAGDGYEEGAAAEQCRPDCGQVVAIGDVPAEWEPGAWDPERSDSKMRARRSEALAVRRNVRVGDFVMFRPYSGTRWREGQGMDICVLGFDPLDGDPASDDLVMVLRDGDWRCLFDWALLEMDDLAASKTVLSSRHLFSGCGKVCDIGPDGSFGIGDRVATSNDMHLQSSDDPKWLRTKWTTLQERHLLVREVDSSGVRRLIGRID